VSQALIQSRQVITAHSKSFALASRVLPPASRDRAVVLYGFCRRADDAVDGVPARHQGAAVARLEAELDDVYAGRATGEPLLDAFAELVSACRIPRAYPAELLAGMRMDALARRYQTTAELLEYCFRVAGTVGLMMCHVLGLEDEDALRNATHLGIAMQLTNICRDVAEDWAMDRLYVPDDVLAACGAAGLAGDLGGPFPGQAREPMRRAVRHLLAEADVYYRSGDRGLRALPWRAALAVRTARLVYADIGTRIHRQGCDPLRGRAYVPGWRKLLLCGRAAASAALEAPARVVRRGRPAIPERTMRFPHDVLPV
jgi:15-cis-phytoene synthase